MNQIHKSLAILSLATILGGPAIPAFAQNAPLSLAQNTPAGQTTPKAIDLFNQGLRKMERQDFQGAITDFNESLKIEPNNAETYYFRGLAFDLLEENDKAIEDYSSAIRISPENSSAYNNRGTVYAELKNYPKAIEDYNQALQLDAENANAYYNRGLAHAALEKSTEAIADFQKAADIYKKEGKTEDYQDAMNRITELDPQKPKTP
ncbi:MAG TPA: tetratricopeptide repeat protein [Halomicronema sp.]